jgi:hypothetical protein
MEPLKCDKCNKPYKTQKTLDQHMIKMHPDIVSDIVSDVKSDIKPDVKPDVKSSKDVVATHECNNCNKCKDDIIFLKLTNKLLILRYAESLDFSKDVNDNFKTAFDNFAYFNNNINKMKKDIEFLMNQDNNKSKEHKDVIKKTKSKK